MKTLKRLHRLSKLGMSTLDKQRRISTNDVFYLWTQLVQRYFVTHLTEIFASIARDEDLKLILVYGKRVLVKNIELLEKKMIENGIPLPTRPEKHRTHRTFGNSHRPAYFQKGSPADSVLFTYPYHGFNS